MQLGHYFNQDDRPFASREFSMDEAGLAEANERLHGMRPSKTSIVRMRVFEGGTRIASAAFNDEGQKLVLESMPGVYHDEPQRFFDSVQDFAQYVQNNMK
jgi:hypothetical protein